MNTSNLRLLRALIAAPVAVFALPAIASAQAAATVRSEVAEAKADAHKAALDEIDHAIDQLDAAVDHAPTEADKAQAKANLKSLKERRSELRKSYASARYDELKADISKEYAKASAWTKKTFTSTDAEKANKRVTDEAHDLASKAKAAVNPAANSVATNLALYQLNPSPENKAEVKQALDALDDELDRREDAAKTLAKGPERDAEEKFIKEVRDRESELRKSFVKARWDALVGDMKARWHRLTS